MYFQVKSIFKSNHYHNAKHYLSLSLELEWCLALCRGLKNMKLSRVIVKKQETLTWPNPINSDNFLNLQLEKF